jgi:hypothetical protein
MGDMTIAVRQYQPTRNMKQFEALLKAWQRGEDVAWSDLMAAWVKTPTAPLTQDTVQKVIHCLEEK